jgi:uncharacterized membrane protein YfcA
MTDFPLELVAAIAVTMVGTSFLSGVFGMAGGMVLVGVLLVLLPLPAAMALHAVTQIASNVWRAVLWRKWVRWRIVAAYIVGCSIAMAVLSLWLFVPSKGVALLMLGISPFLAHALPKPARPAPESFRDGVAIGVSCMTLLILTGVAGPLLDTFFLGARSEEAKLDRREIVATKGFCQIFGHAAKLLYFGGLIENAASLDPVLVVVAVAASMLGTVLARRLLESMSEGTYRRWASRIVTGVACWYVAYGGWLVVTA